MKWVADQREGWNEKEKVWKSEQSGEAYANFSAKFFNLATLCTYLRTTTAEADVILFADDSEFEYNNPKIIKLHNKGEIALTRVYDILLITTVIPDGSANIL